MKNDSDLQDRFYFVMTVFFEDERLATFALVEFFKLKIQPKKIYKDLLECRWSKWIDKLEQITENTKWTVLERWCINKQQQLNSSDDEFWRTGDLKLLGEQETLKERT